VWFKVKGWNADLKEQRKENEGYISEGEEREIVITTPLQGQDRGGGGD